MQIKTMCCWLIVKYTLLKLTQLFCSVVKGLFRDKSVALDASTLDRLHDRFVNSYNSPVPSSSGTNRYNMTTVVLVIPIKETSNYKQPSANC
jgi:hypothetical protein